MKHFFLLYFSLVILLLAGCNSLSKEDRAAYDLLVKSGNTLLKMNEAELAKGDFKNALHIHPTGKEAVIGLKDAYQLNCKLFDQDCNEAQHLADSLGLN